MTPRRIAALVVAILVGTPALLFWLQNRATRVNLVFKVTPNLAWDLGPGGISLPTLLAVAFLLGVLLTASWLGALVAIAGRRSRSLQRQVTALQDEIEFNRRNAARAAKPLSPASQTGSSSSDGGANKPAPAPSPFDDLS